MTERFNAIAADWDKGDMRVQIATSVFSTLTSRIALDKNMTILDFGAGTGLLSFQVATMVNKVIGIDLSEKMLEQISIKNSDELSVTPLKHDILAESMGQTFNGIVSSMAMHHVEDTEKLFESFHQHLKRDGFIAIADLDSEDGTFHSHGNDGVYHFGFEREALRRIVEKAGFSNVRFHHAHTIEKGDMSYPIFLLTGQKYS